MSAAELLRAEARDYRTKAIARDDQGDEQAASAFKIVALVLYEVAEALEHDDELQDAA